MAKREELTRRQGLFATALGAIRRDEASFHALNEQRIGVVTLRLIRTAQADRIRLPTFYHFRRELVQRAII